MMMKWHEEEEIYLNMLHDICIELSKEYMDLYTVTHKFQTKLRLPSIILSSCSGVASFGSSGFGLSAQKYISLIVGVVNVGIAVIQTYESYLKIGDIVSKSLSCSQSFKKLADVIHCEIFIPKDERNANGITFLRDCFSKYQTILDQAPPMEFHGKRSTDTYEKAKAFASKMSSNLRESRVAAELSAVASGSDTVHQSFLNMSSRATSENPMSSVIRAPEKPSTP
jgi:hypothetical protein